MALTMTLPSVQIEHLDLIFNLIFTAAITTQSFHIFRLHQHKFLDSSSVQSLYKSFFTLLTVSSIGMISLNLKTRSSSILDLFFIPIILVSAYHGIIAHYTKSYGPDHTSGLLTMMNNDTHLLITSEPTTPMNIDVSTTQQMAAPNLLTKNHHMANLASRDISPMSSLSKQKISINSYGSTSTSKPSSLSKVKTPILATLLNADTVLALGAVRETAASTDAESMSFWQLLMILFIAISFTSSQIIYSISVFKTNLYTSPKQLYTMFSINLFTSMAIIISFCFKNQALHSIFTFSGPSTIVLNMIIPFALLSQSSLSLCLQLRNQRKRGMATFSSIRVYDSTGTTSTNYAV